MGTTSSTLENAESKTYQVTIGVKNIEEINENLNNENKNIVKISGPHGFAEKINADLSKRNIELKYYTIQQKAGALKKHAKGNSVKKTRIKLG